jgi:hypothetical protein
MDYDEFAAKGAENRTPFAPFVPFCGKIWMNGD